MKGNRLYHELYHGFSENEIFKNDEDKYRILSLKEVEKEKIIGERVDELNRRREMKELLNDKKDKTNDNKKNKIYDDQHSSSDSEELGEIKNERKNSSKRRKASNSNHDEESILTVGDEDDKQVKKENRSISLEEINNIKLDRNFFLSYYNYPIFDEKVKGAIIKVNLSSLTVTNFSEGYELGEIDHIVINKDKPYNFMGNKCTKYVKLKYSSSDKYGSMAMSLSLNNCKEEDENKDEYSFKVISNSKISEEELNKWLSYKQKIPTSEEIALIQKNIKDIIEHKLSNDELNNILTQKKKDRIKYKDSTLNVTEELDLAQEKLFYYKEKYNEEKEKGEKGEKEICLKKMKEIEEDIKLLEKMKEERDKKEKLNSENDIVAKINEDIRKKQKMDEKLSMLQKKRKKDKNDREHQLFKRVDCHPTTLFDSTINAKEKNEEEKQKQKETEKKIEKEKEQKKKKNNNNFKYVQKIKQLKDYMEEHKNYIEEMMGKEKEKKKENENKKNEKSNEVKKNEGEIESKEKNDKLNDKKDDIDMSMFWKLASINFENFNKIIKEQNKKNTIDPQVKIIGLNAYLDEFSKE